MQTAKDFPDLNKFLKALCLEGIPIGPYELIRLQHVFDLEPTLDQEQLKALLACTLIKQPTQRETFEMLFSEWYQRAEAQTGGPKEFGILESTLGPIKTPNASVSTPSTPSSSIHSPDDQKDPASSHPSGQEQVQRKRRWGLIVAVVLGLGLLSYPLVAPYISKLFLLQYPPPPPPPPPPSGQIIEREGDLPSQPVEFYSTWVPTPTIPDPPLVNPLWFALGLSLLALANGGLLWWRYQHRSTIPEQEEPPGAGPQWLPLLEQQLSGPELLQRDELQAAIWGVERFVSEDETRTVDIDQTVSATANAGGQPEIRYERAIYPREVWLWRDVMVQDPTVDRLIDELESCLRLAGLPVRVGIFIGTPLLVQWREGQEFSPLIIEGHRQNALVIILTDGYGISLALEPDLDKNALNNLLRAFGEWPRLTFVDLGNGQHRLAKRLSKTGLACISVEDIPDFLGAGPMKPSRSQAKDAALVGDLHAWAATTALSPEPVADEDAHALRNALELSLPAWQFRNLCSAAGGYYGRLVWTPSQRVDLLNWLAQCSVTKGEIAENSLLDRALNYWLKRYKADSQQREQHQNILLPWKRTPAEQRERMEIALLELWREPRQAIPALYRLKDHLGSEIRERLSGLTDWSRHQSQSGLVHLPWQTETLPTRLQLMLSELGFSRYKTQPVKGLQSPPQLWLAVGLSAGLFLGGIGWCILGPSTPILDPHLPSPFPVIQTFQQSTIGDYQLTIGTPKELQIKTAPAYSTIPVSWEWKTQQPNIEKSGNSQLWRAGTLAQPIRGCEDNWPARSLFIIQAAPTDKSARQLAIQLLDRGSADRVLLGTDWPEHVDKLVQGASGLSGNQQLVIVAPRGAPIPAIDFPGAVGVIRSSLFATLAKRLESFSGVRPLPEIWPKPEGNGQLMLRSGPEEEKDEKTGITFVKVCGGTFMMGTEKEKTKYDNETPPHPVTLDTFEISKTETTNGQYQLFQKEYKGEENLPAVNVSWDDAKAFCKNFGYALPTEAEWEYAARGGSTTRWSFGDDEKQLGDYGWFSENSKGSSPVGQKLPNPLGLYDMHGNVWEWVEDCYDTDSYKDRSPFITNPLVGQGGISSCDTRVLRGGSFRADAEFLRSAFRSWLEPLSRSDFIGFRCVRRPRRQS